MGFGRHLHSLRPSGFSSSCKLNDCMCFQRCAIKVDKCQLLDAMAVFISSPLSYGEYEQRVLDEVRTQSTEVRFPVLRLSQ